MDETKIAGQLADSRPPEPEHTPAAITAPELTGFGSAEIEMDEMTQYKLHDIFDAKYEANDQEARGQLQYIYSTVSEMVGSEDYPLVAAKMRELMRVAGIAHSDRKLYKLYQWLRLSNMMRSTSKEMESLRDA